MKKTWNVVTILLLLAAVLLPVTGASAATDGYYTLAETTAPWDGTTASRTIARTADYTYTYGDEASITYTLPWAFIYYNQSFNQITADTNGNIWFTSTGSAHSYSLGANNGRGPVIAAWNNDLSSNYYGGVFIQHKTGPERIVIEWQTETYTEEGFSKLNNFEAVLSQNGNIRFDYKPFSTTTGKDFGTGISMGDGSAFFLSLTTNYANAFTLGGRSFQFNITPLTPDFSGGTTAGTPFEVTFTNLTNQSQWPVTWLWEFGDGATSTLQNPLPHLYTAVGSYTVRLTATNQAGSNTTSKVNYVTGTTCLNLPVRVVGKSDYTTLTNALDAPTTLDNDVIKMLAIDFTASANAFTVTKAVTVEGGYACDYTSTSSGTTIIHGAPRISAGNTVKMKNIRVSN